MIDELLASCGFIKGKTYKETRFLKSPKEPFAVWADSKSARGSDLKNMIVDHAYTIEIYTYLPDDTQAQMLEAWLNEHGIEWECFERTWLSEDQIFMTTYMFDVTEKL